MSRTIVFVAWPEIGHLVAPFALAKRLRRRGDRVVFAGPGRMRARVEANGFEFSSLEPNDATAPIMSSTSLFSLAPIQLSRAVDEIVDGFERAVLAQRPTLVLFDTLYSPFAILAENNGVNWAHYETDLPRELDGRVPPTGAHRACDASDARELRRGWARLLWAAYRSRRQSRGEPLVPCWSMTSRFPDALIRELERRFPARLSFDRATLFSPIARGPRLVFCPPDFDFPRENARDLVYAGACIDETREEPPFAWDALPEERPLVYCAFGSQSIRNPIARGLVRILVSAFSAQREYFLVIACPPAHARGLTADPRSVRVVDTAPQLSLLRRATVALTHAGFNSVKECALGGVPMLAMPLSHDQPRNAALIEHHGIGVALETSRLDSASVLRAIEALQGSASVHQRCQAMASALLRSNVDDIALSAIDSVLELRSSRPKPAALHQRPERVP